VSALTSADAQVDVVTTHVDVAQSSLTAAVLVDDVGKDSHTAGNEATSSSPSAVSGLDTAVDATAADVSVGVSSRHSDADAACLLHQLSQRDAMPASSKSGAVFWKSSWRQHLCRCPGCMVNIII